MISSFPYNVTFKTCDICFDKDDPSISTFDPGSRLITCTRCKANVHARCYGEGNIDDSLKLEFTCKKCLSLPFTPPVFRGI